MQWLETEPDLEVPPSVAISLLRRVIEKNPDNPTSHQSLGDEFLRCGQIADSVTAYEAAALLGPADFQRWARLAACYLELGRPEAALDACHLGEAHTPSADIQFQRGCALNKLRRFADARAAFLSAISASTHFPALKAVLRPMAKEPSGKELLEFCEALPRPYTDSALVRANRAIALSRVGRTRDALELVDLTRHVARIPIVPLSPFQGIAQFNRQLADDIISGKSVDTIVGQGYNIRYAPRFDRSQALLSLCDLVKSAIDNYLGEVRTRGLDAIMPPPARGKFFGATLILREDGHNGEHIHARGYVSAVYYVAVPEIVTQATDDRGSLALGGCENYTGGYTPCWGTRYIKPVAGSLVIFPSHIYHNVVPSRTAEPRVSVAVDLQPVAGT
jgi:hypothetical protein